MSVDPNFQAASQECKYCHKPLGGGHREPVKIGSPGYIEQAFRRLFPDSEACCECTETGVAAPPSSSLPPVAAAQTYSELCDQLVYTEEGIYDTDCLLTPRSRGEDEFEADVCCYVCERTKMKPEDWHGLKLPQRIPWVKDALVKARAARPQSKRVEGSVELVKGQKPVPAVWYEELPPKGTKQKRRHRTPPRDKILYPTAAELEAILLVSENNGSYTKAAKAAGKSRTMITRQYKNALKKGIRLPKLLDLAKTQRLSTAGRGQVNVPDPKQPAPHMSQAQHARCRKQKPADDGDRDDDRE